MHFVKLPTTGRLININAISSVLPLLEGNCEVVVGGELLKLDKDDTAALAQYIKPGNTDPANAILQILTMAVIAIKQLPINFGQQPPAQPQQSTQPAQPATRPPRPPQSPRQATQTPPQPPPQEQQS